jgi:hypothetical protein
MTDQDDYSEEGVVKDELYVRNVEHGEDEYDPKQDMHGDDDDEYDPNQDIDEKGSSRIV